MSASSLLVPGSNKINSAYLPNEALVTPTLTQVIQASPFSGGAPGGDAGNLIIGNIAGLVVGANTLPPGIDLYTMNDARFDGKVAIGDQTTFIENNGGNLQFLLAAGFKLFLTAGGGPLGEVYDTVNNPVYLKKGQAQLNAGVATVTVVGVTPTSVIIATCIGQIVSQSSTVVVDSIVGNVITFRATDASDNRLFNYVVFA